ncbi:Hypothetical protein UVM_LOCUS176 [uncultured virus]|nr:Hypothetical protein UVM_LOCUS176 [uncultured virus]
MARTMTEHKYEKRVMGHFVRKYSLAIGAFHRWYRRQHEDFLSNPPVFTLHGDELFGICALRDSADPSLGVESNDSVSVVVILANLDDGKPFRIIPIGFAPEDLQALDFLAQDFLAEKDFLAQFNQRVGTHLEVFNVLRNALDLLDTLDRAPATVGLPTPSSSRQPKKATNAARARKSSVRRTSDPDKQ